MISLYIGHDASVAVSQNGRVQCVLELERLFEERQETCGALGAWVFFFRGGVGRKVLS